MSKIVSVFAGISLVVLIAACSPSVSPRLPVNATGIISQPLPNVAPVTISSVSSSDLPPIGGTTANGNFASNAPAADPSVVPGTSPDFVSLNDISSTVGAAGTGRDLTGSLTMEKLIGGWNIEIAGQQCRLNLTYTAKGASGRYRASTPSCGQATLASVTSWMLLGNQINLYDEADKIVGTLLRKGDQFVGTVAGGQIISMHG